jgi:hypothetical protein
VDPRLTFLVSLLPADVASRINLAELPSEPADEEGEGELSLPLLTHGQRQAQGGSRSDLLEDRVVWLTERLDRVETQRVSEMRVVQLLLETLAVIAAIVFGVSKLTVSDNTDGSGPSDTGQAR